MSPRPKRSVNAAPITPPSPEVARVNAMLAMAENDGVTVFDPTDFSTLPVIESNRPASIRMAVLRRAGASYGRKGQVYYSTMIILPKVALELAGVKMGDPMLIMTWDDGTIVLRKAGGG